MILETTEAPPLTDPSAADVDAAIERIKSAGRGEIQLRRSEKDSVTIQLSHGDRFKIYIQRPIRPQQSRNEVGESLARGILSSYMTGMVSLPSAIRMEPLSERPDLELMKVQWERLSPSDQKSQLLDTRRKRRITVLSVLALPLLLIGGVLSPLAATIDEYSKVMALATAAAVLVTGTAALVVIERSFRRRLKELE